MTLEVQIWSDVACPWCFVGKRRLEGAARARGIELSVTWRSFELDPRKDPEETRGLSYVARLARKYSIPESHAQNMIDQMTQLGAEVGITFDFTRAIPANTFDAHRALHHARAHGRGDALKERLLRAHFCEGRDVADVSTLASLAEDVGLRTEPLVAALQSDDYARAVRGEETAARELGVSGVPFFVIGSHAIGGAQRQEVFEQALQRALDEEPGSRKSAEATTGEGAYCGPESC